MPSTDTRERIISDAMEAGAAASWRCESQPDVAPFVARINALRSPVERGEGELAAGLFDNARELREVVDLINLCIYALEGRDGADVCTELAVAGHRIDMVIEAVALELAPAPNEPEPPPVPVEGEKRYNLSAQSGANHNLSSSAEDELRAALVRNLADDPRLFGHDDPTFGEELSEALMDGYHAMLLALASPPVPIEGEREPLRTVETMLRRRIRYMEANPVEDLADEDEEAEAIFEAGRADQLAFLRSLLAALPVQGEPDNLCPHRAVEHLPGGLTRCVDCGAEGVRPGRPPLCRICKRPAPDATLCDSCAEDW